MTEQKRTMPSKKTLRVYWSDHLLSIGRFDSLTEFHEGDYCFACGMECATEKAHIEPRAEGGIDGCENIHLLCPLCHADSEPLQGVKYWQWFNDGGYFGKHGRLRQLIETAAIA